MRQEYTHSTQLHRTSHIFLLCVCFTYIYFAKNRGFMHTLLWFTFHYFLSISSTQPFNSPNQTCLFLQLTRLHVLKCMYIQAQGSIFYSFPVQNMYAVMVICTYLKECQRFWVWVYHYFLVLLFLFSFKTVFFFRLKFYYFLWRVRRIYIRQTNWEAEKEKKRTTWQTHCFPTFPFNSWATWLKLERNLYWMKTK